MRMNNIQMTTTVVRKDLLAKLKENLSRHAQIVKEAREGYVQQARKALEARLRDILEGKCVALTFLLDPPADYTEVYKNSIEMLEWNTQDQVVLEADEFRQLVRDEWDWMSTFLASNKAYSVSATRMSDEKGL
jgi:hypothetical protein